jgi:hypothetical protein
MGELELNPNPETDPLTALQALIALTKCHC